VPWYKADLSHIQVEAGELITLTNDFEYIFLDSGEPEGMALFQGETAPGHCTIYFSPGSLPGAQYLIAGYSGEPCDVPMKKILKYLAGDMNLLDSLE